MDNLIEVEEIVLFEDELEVTVDKSRPILRPSVVISGVSIKEEILFLQERETPAETSVPLYVELNDEVEQIGLLNLTLDSLLLMASLGYKITLWHEDGRQLNLKDSSVLMNFLRLSVV
jgi:hypothetical protein